MPLVVIPGLCHFIPLNLGTELCGLQHVLHIAGTEDVVQAGGVVG